MNNFHNIGKVTKILVLEVSEMNPQLRPLMEHILHMRRRDDILTWLIKNRITGDRLLKWCLEDHRRSFLAITTEIIGRLEKDRKRPILVGRDYVPD